MIKYLFLLLFLPIAIVKITCQSQQPVAYIPFFSRGLENHIELRWSISEPAVWQIANKNGYKIERAEISETNEINIPNLNFEEIKNSPIRPWSIDSVQTYLSLNQNVISERDYELAAIGYTMSVSVDSTQNNFDFADNLFEQGLTSLKEEKNKLELQYLYAMFAADHSALAAKMCGLRCTDLDVMKGKNYIYRISINGPINTYNIQPSLTEVKCESDTSLINLNQKIYVKELDKEIQLAWKNLPNLSSFSVLRSEDNKATYSKVNEHPIIIQKIPNTKSEGFTWYKDDSLTNGNEYFYKIYTLTPFADEIQFASVRATPKDLTPPSKPFLKSVKHIAPNIAQIQWEMDIEKNDDLSGFEIVRSDSMYGNYYKIHNGLIPPDWHIFNDLYFKNEGNNFYIVRALDKSGNYSRSGSLYLSLIDSVPPTIPIPISGFMDSLGIVTLELEPQHEADFMGYRLYKANAPDHEFSVAQETYNDTIVENARNSIIIDTSTIESLTKYVYYKITALDYHYNESDFSEIIKVPRPDKFPPVPPLISKYKAFDDRVEIQVIASTSQDVFQNYLWRKRDADSTWTLIDSIGLKDTVIVDNQIPDNGYYQYTVNAEDLSGLVSDYGNTILVKTYYKPRPLEMDIQCTNFPSDNMVIVTWQLNEILGEDVQFVIYKSTNGNQRVGTSNINPEPVYVFQSDESMNYVSISGKTPTKEFTLKRSEVCQVSSDSISNDERYIEFIKSN